MGHHRHAIEAPLKWRFSLAAEDGHLIVVFGPSLLKKKKKKKKENAVSFGLLLAFFFGSVYAHKVEAIST